MSGSRQPNRNSSSRKDRPKTKRRTVALITVWYEEPAQELVALLAHSVHALYREDVRT